MRNFNFAIEKPYIFRVERKDDGRGMYQSGYGLHSCKSYKTEFSRHPTPFDDSLLRDNMRAAGIGFDFTSYIFGFISIEQLRSWLYRDEWINYLIKNDFILRVYMGEVIVGHTQAIIKDVSKELFTEISLRELLPEFKSDDE